MRNLSYIILVLFFTISCSCNNQIDNKEQKVYIHMEESSFYPDSLTDIQKNYVEKKFNFIHNPQYYDSKYPPEKLDGYLTEEERDAIIEISILDLRKKIKVVNDSIFSHRVKEIFGLSFDSISEILETRKSQFPIRGEKITNTHIELDLLDSYRELHISKKENVIIEGFNLGGEFENSDEITSFHPYTRREDISPCPEKTIDVSRIEHMFHQNNYLFNEANVSRTWLIIKDPYFMSHLLIEYGYDGDNEINKLVLKKIKEDDKEIIDIPVDPFHIYPDGRVKILDGLLKTAAEMSTAECADYFDWATSNVDLLSGADDSKDKIWRIKHLTVSQRREIVAHIVDYMLPIYHKFLGTNYKYGTTDLDFGDLRIIDCFWNSLMQDHELISEIEKNGYYGLSNLQSQVEAIKDFKPFYNEKSGEFEPWNYVPMRYRNSDDE